MNKEEMRRIEKIINKCKECRLHECIQCEISYTDICAISRLYNDYLKYKEELETSIIPSYEETIKELEKQLFEQQEGKDKIIDLMAEQLAGLAIFDIDKDETLILGNKEEVKQYYKQKSEQK